MSSVEKAINISILVSCLLLVTFVSLIATGSLQSVWFDTGDTIYYERSNPSRFDIGINAEQGFSNINLKIDRYTSSYREYHCYYTDPAMVSYMASRFGGY